MFNALACSDIDSIPFIAVTISTPFDRYKQLLQLRKSIIEIQNESNQTNECVNNTQYPNFWQVNTMDMLTRDNVARGFIFLITRISNFAFKSLIKDKFVMHKTDNNLSINVKSISSEVTSKIYGLSAYYFVETYRTYSIFKGQLSTMQSLYSGFGVQCLRIILQTTITNIINDKFNDKFDNGSNGLITVSFGFVWFSIAQIITYPLDTISKRQTITNESPLQATKHLIRKYGYVSLYDGICWEIVSDFIAYTSCLAAYFHFPNIQFSYLKHC
eukprot:508320_1